MIEPSNILDATSAGTIQGRDEFLLPGMLHLYEEPLVLAEGNGVRVKDPEGNEYLDLFAGILTTSVGHCNPNVVDAVTTQMKKVGHISTLYGHEMHVEAARKIANIAPGMLNRTFFSNSGTEAVETALMMACLATGRSEIIALRVGYHGRSFMATSVTAHSGWRPLATPVAGIKHAKSPNLYRCCPSKTPCDETCVDKFVDDLEEVIVTTTNGRPAAFIAETIMGVAGYVVPPMGYFEKAAEVIRHYGGLLVIDEVQAGFGRCGDHWFGIQHHGVEPDIMVMAKGIANGAPVGATVTTDEIAHLWKGKHISTFGGNPVSMAALCATQEELHRHNAPQNARERGDQLREALKEMQARHPWMGDVRGMGLMQAIEVVKDPVSKEPDLERTKKLLEASREEGVLVGLGGLYGTVVRIGPSLLITEQEMAEGIEKLGRAVDRVGS